MVLRSSIIFLRHIFPCFFPKRFGPAPVSIRVRCEYLLAVPSDSGILQSVLELHVAELISIEA